MQKGKKKQRRHLGAHGRDDYMLERQVNRKLLSENLEGI